MDRVKRPLLAVAAAVTCATAAACIPLHDLGAGGVGPGIKPPAVTFAGATLAGAPTPQLLAAYYCPELVSVPLGGATLLCQSLFGPRPPLSAMAVVFDARFRITNPNEMPLPLASLLVGVTLFPAAGNQRTGAACLRLCPGGPGTCATDDPGACQASSRDIRSLSDFAAATAGLVIAEGLAAAAGQPPSFTAPTVSAAAELEVSARFTLAPAQLVGVLRQLAEQSTGDLRAGRAPRFAVPYQLEGTIWFDAGSLGRVAIPWGPASGVWTL
jgi:hypothetical protein